MRSRGPQRLLVVLCLCLGLVARASTASPANEQARTVVHLLDYVSADYPEFVKGGSVLNAAEYAEQHEFAEQVVALLQAVQPPADPGLVAAARTLLSRIEAKADGDEVAGRAKALRAQVIAAYGLVVAPRQLPDLRAGAALFQDHCASCHGARGEGNGPQGAGLDPAPRNFHDAGKMEVRSLYGLYSTISLGLGGTSMRAFTELTEAERWELAFTVARLRSTPEEQALGAKRWADGLGKDHVPDLAALVNTTPRDMEEREGVEGKAVLAYLTAHPEALQAVAPSPLAIARAKLEQSRAAYAAGDRSAASQLAISAYLDGFELTESALNNVDAPLRADIEREMMALRSTLARGAPVDTVNASVAHIGSLLDRAEGKLSGGGLTAMAAFFSSLLILFREGLEALLVLAAIIALVKKTGRPGAMRFIHAGWLGAVLLGGITWAVARYLLAISGASRELTEGITALIAAAMLLYVGYWLHNKSNAQAWQSFIRGQVDSALGKRTLWALAGISFLAVYRELFEMVLFYETLLGQAGPAGQHAVYAGIVVALLLLVVIGALILKFSVRLPLGPFFTATAGLLALMAVIFAGNGVAALQEAGILHATAVRFFSAPLLGIYPTAQSLLMQAAVLVLVFVGIWVGRRRMRVAKG